MKKLLIIITLIVNSSVLASGLESNPDILESTLLIMSKLQKKKYADATFGFTGCKASKEELKLNKKIEILVITNCEKAFRFTSNTNFIQKDSTSNPIDYISARISSGEYMLTAVSYFLKKDKSFNKDEFKKFSTNKVKYFSSQYKEDDTVYRIELEKLSLDPNATIYATIFVGNL